jgi:hypothetical protein
MNPSELPRSGTSTTVELSALVAASASLMETYQAPWKILA